MKITKKAIFGFLMWLVIIATLNFTVVRPVSADETLLNSMEGSSYFATLFGGGEQDARTVVVKIINVALSFLAVIFLFLLVLAGFKYMLSGGNETKTKEALAQIKNAIIGLIIVLASWVIARYVIVITDRVMQNKVDYINYY